MRFLCFDIGDKRTGVASGDDDLGIAGPLDVIHSHSREDLAVKIAAFIESENIRQIVIGLPLNMDGTEGPRAKIVRGITDDVVQRVDCTIHFHDERQSTQAANKKMAQSGLTHAQKKARRDAIAATVILQEFLDLP